MYINGILLGVLGTIFFVSIFFNIVHFAIFLDEMRQSAEQ